MKHILTFVLSVCYVYCFAQSPVLDPISGLPANCIGTAASYSTSATNSPTAYAWSANPANVTINGSATSASLSVSYQAPGTYTLMCSAVNGSGASNTEQFVVTVFETPTVNFSGSNTFCQGSSTNLSASSTVLQGSPTISYSWAPPAGLNATTGQQVIANPATATNYTVTAVNGACSNTGTITITPFQQLSVTFSGATTFCQGSSTNLSASSTVMQASSTISYNWSPAYGLNTTNGANVVANPANATTYTVTAHYGSCSNTGTIAIAPTTVSVSLSGANTFCQGQSTALSASATVSQGSPVMSYSWSPPTGLNTTTGPGVSANPAGATLYTVTATNGICSHKATILVTPFEQIPITISGVNTFCQGSSTSLTASSTASPTNSISYSWLPATGLNTTTGNAVTANPATAVNYTVTATNGACATTQTITVTPFEQLAVTFSGANTFCQGSSTNLSASSTVMPAGSPVSYNWSPSYGLNTTTGTNVIANPANATTYTVTAHYSSCSTTGTLAVTPITLSVSVSGANTSCPGQPAVLSASATVSQGSSVMSYGWSPPAGLNTSTGATVNANPAGSTNYTVTATNGVCSNKATITVMPFAQIPFTISGANTFCQGSSTSLTASSAASPTNSISYSWLPATGLNTTSGSTVTANPATAVNYTVTVTNGVCANTRTITVTPFEEIPVTISGANTFCDGLSTSLTASAAISPTTAVSYSWLPATDLNTATGANVVANPANATTYTVTAYFGTCTNTAQITVSRLSSPTITAVASRTAVCTDDTVTFNGYGATTYTWNYGIQNGVPYPVSFGGPYVVTGTGANGCSATASVSITVDNMAVFSISSSNFMIWPGSGDSATLTINGTANTTYSMNGVATSTTVVVTPSVTTTYTFTSGNPSGCQYTYVYTQYVEYPVGVETISNKAVEHYFKVFPNPSNGVFNIRSNTKETVKIINELGEIVRVLELEPDTDGQISGLSSGMYVVSTGKTNVRIIVTQ